MHRAYAVVTMVFCLAACTSKPVGPVAGSPNSGTQFSGTVGQLDEGSGFVEFISGHEDKTVTLNIRIPAASFDGGHEKEFDFFVVWDDCDNLPEGQKPSNIFCTGFEYNIPKLAGGASPLAKDTNGWTLRGRFKVWECRTATAGAYVGDLGAALAARGSNQTFWT